MSNDKSIDFEFDGELNPKVALNQELLNYYDFCGLKNEANILVMPDLHSAGISLGLLQAMGGIDIIGGCLFG